MRARKQLVAAALALPLLTGAVACGELQEAQQGVQQAQENVSQAQESLGAVQACAEAADVARFTPDFTNPQQARSEAEAKARKLGELAQQTNDQTLKQNLLDAQDSLDRVASGEITAQNSAQWIQNKLDRTRKILATCSRING